MHVSRKFVSSFVSTKLLLYLWYSGPTVIRTIDTTIRDAKNSQDQIMCSKIHLVLLQKKERIWSKYPNFHRTKKRHFSRLDSFVQGWESVEFATQIAMESIILRFYICTLCTWRSLYVWCLNWLLYLLSELKLMIACSKKRIFISEYTHIYLLYEFQWNYSIDAYIAQLKQWK